MGRVIERIKGRVGTAFSFEILPPLKGHSIRNVYRVIERLLEFEPQYINITSHHSGNVKRPGSVAIASAIQNRYGIPAVPHIICKGFTKEETEYALLDLHFLGVHDLLLLQGDDKGLAPVTEPHLYHSHAIDLERQVNDFNRGIAIDGNAFVAPETPFAYGMACYPEQHKDAVDAASDLRYAIEKVRLGAEYLVTQMFFDNEKYYDFVQRLRGAGIDVPVIPGIKPIVFQNQLTLLPQVFHSSIPAPLASALRRCTTDEAVKQVGIEWCIQQCKELIAHKVPSLHFYTYLATDSVYRVAQAIY